MRINGRLLRPSTLAERRLFNALGTDTIRVPRTLNPYVIARRARRLALFDHPDFLLLRELVTKYQPSPDADTSEPVEFGGVPMPNVPMPDVP
jgi:hypothetical protein